MCLAWEYWSPWVVAAEVVAEEVEVEEGAVVVAVMGLEHNPTPDSASRPIPNAYSVHSRHIPHSPRLPLHRQGRMLRLLAETVRRRR